MFGLGARRKPKRNQKVPCSEVQWIAVAWKDDRVGCVGRMGKADRCLPNVLSARTEFRMGSRDGNGLERVGCCKKSLALEPSGVVHELKDDTVGCSDGVVSARG